MEMQPAVRHLNKMQCRENMSGALVYTILFETMLRQCKYSIGQERIGVRFP